MLRQTQEHDDMAPCDLWSPSLLAEVLGLRPRQGTEDNDVTDNRGIRDKSKTDFLAESLDFNAVQRMLGTDL